MSVPHLHTPDGPALGPDDLVALSTGTWLVVKWGDGTVQRIRFESSEGIPARHGWATVADLIDGETEAWRDESSAPVGASHVEDALDTTGMTARETSAAEKRENSKEMFQTRTDDSPQRVLCRWEIGSLKIEARLAADDAKQINALVIATLGRDFVK